MARADDPGSAPAASGRSIGACGAGQRQQVVPEAVDQQHGHPVHAGQRTARPARAGRLRRGTPSAASTLGITSARLAEPYSGRTVARPGLGHGRRASRCSWVATSRNGRARRWPARSRPAPPARARARRRGRGRRPPVRRGSPRRRARPCVSRPVAESTSKRRRSVSRPPGAAVRVAQQLRWPRRGGRSSPGPAPPPRGWRRSRWPRRRGAARRRWPRRPPGGESTTSSTLWQSTRSALSAGTRSASASASPCTARTRSPTPASAARRVSAASASGLASTTVTSWPDRASGTANPPVPPPTSTTVSRSRSRRAVELAPQHLPDDGGPGRGVRATGEAALHAGQPSGPQ